MFNWALWGRGIIAAVIAGATTGAIDALSNGDLKGAGKTALMGALVGGLLYLKVHPEPPMRPSSDAAQGGSSVGQKA